MTNQTAVSEAITGMRNSVRASEKSLSEVYQSLMNIACKFQIDSVWQQMAGILPHDHPFFQFVLDSHKTAKKMEIPEDVQAEIEALFESANNLKNDADTQVQTYNEAVRHALTVAVKSPDEHIATLIVGIIGQDHKYYEMASILANNEHALKSSSVIAH